MVHKTTLTFLNILILVERLERVVFGESSEGVNKMRAEVRVDILRVKPRCAGSIHRPVRVVAHHARLA